MPAAVAERVELLDIAEPESGLLFDPGTQPDVEGAVRDGVERPERKPREPAVVAARCRENEGLVAFERDDRRGQPDLDRRQQLLAHGTPEVIGQSRSTRNGLPSTIMLA